MANVKKQKRVRPDRKWFGVSVVAVFLILIVSVAYFVFSGDSNKSSSADVKSMNREIDSLPGGEGTKEYNEKVEKYNKERASKAREEGKSFFPTVVNKSKQTDDLFEDVDNSTEEKEIKEVKRTPKETETEEKTKEKEKEEDRPRVTLSRDEKPKPPESYYRQKYNSIKRDRVSQAEQRRQEKINSLSQTYTKQLSNIHSEIRSTLASQEVQVYQVQENTDSGDKNDANNEGKPDNEENDTNLNLKSGDILYARNTMELDSDVPSSPARVKVVSGEYAGSVLLGGFERQSEFLVVTFDRMILQDGTEVQLEAYAIDPEIPKSVVRSDIDRHMLERWGGLIAASFISGFGEAVRSTGDNLTISDGQTNIARPEMSLNKQLWSAAGKVGDKLAGHFEEKIDQPPTVYLGPDVNIGVLILSIDS